jgi:putative flavoprotein involved in K+ transport
MLDGFDAFACEHGLDGEVGEVQRFAPTNVAVRLRLDIELGRDIETIVWATGYRPDFSWLEVPAFDRSGQLKHDRGVVEAPGLYVLGLPFLRRRKSSFIHGAEDDVREIADPLCAHLDRTARGRPLTLGMAPAPN